MQSISAVIARPVDACWEVFTDPRAMTAWVPGIVDVRLIESRDDGLPREIQFEFASELIYSLLYSYDVADRVVRWEPREGETGAVRGFAQFESVPEGTRFTYALEHGGARKAAERMLDNPRTLVDAFVRWMG